LGLKPASEVCQPKILDLAMPRASVLLVASALAQLLPLCQARLGVRAEAGSVEKRGLSASVLEDRLLAELADVDAHGERLMDLQAQLRPMYLSLPKGDGGSLDHKVVRYALHRFFVHHRGWHLHGLEPSSDNAGSTSLASVLSDRMPAYIQGLLEARLEGQTFGLRELAVLAATMEDLVHGEEMQWLSIAYNMHKIPTDGEVSPQQMSLLLDTFMFYHVVSNMTLSGMTTAAIKAVVTTGSNRYYPGWADTKKWVKDMQLGLQHTERERRNPFVAPSNDYSSAAHVARELGSHFGRFQDIECRSMKQALVEVEQGDSGRVPLRRFHGHAANSGWGFSESADYLRYLGALDETDPEKPSVVIPNYMSSRTNCLGASSGFYSVCCMDECEGLLGSLERDLASPHATPDRLAALVASLPSETVEAPRNLSAQLVGRLHDIAAHHGGEIPVHGRLFAQWMHHAYPRECPYPHAQGSLASPRTASEWMAADGVGSSAVMTMEEIHAAAKYEDEVEPGTAADATVELPWSAEEELPLLSPTKPVGSLVPIVGAAFLLAALVSAALLVASTCRGALASARAPAAGSLPLHKKQQPSCLAPPCLLGRFSSAEQKSHFC